ncbi:MAG: SHOCT domain-containing protein [Carbonactinosporaceae bacterium]
MTTTLTAALGEAPVLAAWGGHGWGDGPGAWWPVFPLLWALLWAAIIITAIVLWRRRAAAGPSRGGESVLAERYARGDISEDEYGKRLAVLRRSRRG